MREKGDRKKKPNRKEVIQTKKPKCENCGEAMLHASMRIDKIGLALWICPHFEGLTRLSVTDSALFCKNDKIDVTHVAQRKGKCPYCGEKLISAYFKSGLCVWICGHAKIQNLDVVNKAIYCKPTLQQNMSMTYLKARLSESHKSSRQRSSAPRCL